MDSTSLAAVKITVSSAYDRDVCTSLKWIVNNSGPNILPCGTPENIASDKAPLNWTDCVHASSSYEKPSAVF